MSGDARAESITRVVEFRARKRASPGFIQELQRMGAPPRLIQAAKGEIGKPAKDKGSQDGSGSAAG